jgi:predicted amidophosphoribosyltransferase
MNSSNTSPLFLQKIDELTRPNHHLLKTDDDVYFLGEYTPGASYQHSETNQIIYNYKKEMHRKGSAEWPYKEKAIHQVADSFRNSIHNTAGLSERISNATLVPIPPSKSKDDPAHDDRNLLMLRRLSPKGDIRELILQKTSREAQRESRISRSPQNLSRYYSLNKNIIHPQPKEIWLFDDVIASGNSFRATHDFLRQTFPKISILGFFIARTVVRKHEMEQN